MSEGIAGRGEEGKRVGNRRRRLRDSNPPRFPSHQGNEREREREREIPMAARLLLIAILATVTISTALASNPNSLLQSEKPLPRPPRPEKLTHLRFYLHDIVSGPNPTTVNVARAAATTNASASATAFGNVNVIDDPLTTGPDLSSHLVGRAQGLYASASQKDLSLIMAMNFAFTDGKYNGSTITVLGHTAVSMPVREMPVVGGSGRFRFARGYVQSRTHKVDFNTGDATVEYNFFVMH